jgi:hypothetical protein
MVEAGGRSRERCCAGVVISDAVRADAAFEKLVAIGLRVATRDSRPLFLLQPRLPSQLVERRLLHLGWFLVRRGSGERAQRRNAVVIESSRLQPGDVRNEAEVIVLLAALLAVATPDAQVTMRRRRWI